MQNAGVSNSESIQMINMLDNALLGIRAGQIKEDIDSIRRCIDLSLANTNDPVFVPTIPPFFCPVQDLFYDEKERFSLNWRVAAGLKD